MEDLLYGISRVTSILTIPLTILTSIVFLLRVAGRGRHKDHVVVRWNRRLRGAHKPMGWALLGLSIVHGIVTETPLFSLNWGTGCLAALLLVVATCILRGHIPGWMRWHRAFTIVFLLTFCVHLVEVDGHGEQRHRQNSPQAVSTLACFSDGSASLFAPWGPDGP